MEAFHAHIYFELEQLEVYKKMKDELEVEFPHHYITGFQITPEPPHTKPNFEVCFYSEFLQDTMDWLVKKQQFNNPVLIHPVVPDRVEAHVTKAIWLGEPIALNLDKLI